MKKLAPILFLFAVVGCQHVVSGQGFHAQECKSVRANCRTGVYEEWYQKNGDLACNCNNPDPLLPNKNY
ncbi:hypothetical protein C2869_21340 [Saccharobesus litoralis]|uniref:Lipoprotein n=1 Tax=Saccharobesus litoralis TaxID=2172099 RepID=A0A2S0VX21_9ALTE|nr:hypothetical protein [Saccharobesus litoralis]AWB68786.1 hypothetical protein C2869_21340 [Saccharobesus litoralis]